MSLNKGPKISVITVCYNSASTISDTIYSVASQIYENREHIIIDGVSTDGTLEIIQNYSGSVELKSEPDEGIYDAMNKGISMASGDIIGFLNADDIFATNESLKRISEVFSDPSIDACYGDLVYVSGSNLDKVIRYWKSCKYMPGLCKSGWMPAHPTFYVREGILKESGGFNTDYNLQADYDLCLRLFEVDKINAVYIPEILIKMRMGGTTNNSLKNIIKGNIEAYSACKSLFPETTPMFIPKKMYSRISQFFIKPENI